MAGLSGRARRLERDARSDLDSFELLDGSRYYFAISGELFLFCCSCLEAGSAHDWPEPPEMLLKVLEAKDPAAALVQIGAKELADVLPFDVQTIIDERRLVPCAIVPGEDPYERVTDDLSE